jgi:acetyl esterase
VGKIGHNFAVSLQSMAVAWPSDVAHTSATHFISAGIMAPTDYQNLIDAPTWAFIARTNACYSNDTASRSVAQQRSIYDAMCRTFHCGYPTGVTARDTQIAGVPCRIYSGGNPTVIYLHGGGFVVGGLHSHDDVCAEICARTGFKVVSVDYRLAPEHLHPAGFDDALAVARDIAQTGPYMLAGDSAGGTLAASVAHAMRRTAPAHGLVLIYAGLGGDKDQGSYLTHAHAPMLTREDVIYYNSIRYAGGNAPLNDPTAAPLQDSDFAGLPPTIAISAECDPVADDGRDYCARITACGGHATWHLELGLVHGYLRARHTVPRASQSFNRIITAISTLGASP